MTLRKNFKLRNNPNWGGGVTFRNGYRYVKRLQHRNADPNGYVPEHRVIYEEFYKCSILDWVDVHHINGVKDDNRLENMQLMSHRLHISINFKKDMSARTCLICGSDKTFLKKSIYPIWYKFQDGFICNKCNLKKRRERLCVC